MGRVRYFLVSKAFDEVWGGGADDLYPCRVEVWEWVELYFDSHVHLYGKVNSPSSPRARHEADVAPRIFNLVARWIWNVKLTSWFL